MQMGLLAPTFKWQPFGTIAINGHVLPKMGMVNVEPGFSSASNLHAWLDFALIALCSACPLQVASMGQEVLIGMTHCNKGFGLAQALDVGGRDLKKSCSSQDCNSAEKDLQCLGRCPSCLYHQKLYGVESVGRASPDDPCARR